MWSFAQKWERDNAFLNDKAVCFEKWIYWDDKSALYYLLTCLSSGELSLFINPSTLGKVEMIDSLKSWTTKADKH